MRLAQMWHVSTQSKTLARISALTAKLETTHMSTSRRMDE